jgi:hypothetical protein
VLRDVLLGEHCPRCGAGAIGAESERVASTMYVVMCEHFAWHELQVWFVRCGLCRRVWPVVAQQQEISEALALAVLRTP